MFDEKPILLLAFQNLKDVENITSVFGCRNIVWGSIRDEATLSFSKIYQDFDLNGEFLNYMWQ